jgi:hypothetical protein
MTEFEAEIRNSLRALTSQVSALSAGLDKTKAAGKKMGDEVDSAFKKAKEASAAAKKKQDDFNKSILQTGQALQKMGGPLAGIVGQLTGGAGLPAGLARAAAGAALLGIAWKAFSAVSEMNLDRTKKLIEAQRELRDVSTGAAKSIKSQALGAVSSQGANLKTLAFRGGGEDYINLANNLAKRGVTSLDDAQKGMASIAGVSYGRNEEEKLVVRQRLREVGEQVALSGEGGFGETVDKIISDPVMMRRLANDGGQSVTERMIVRNRGQLETSGNLETVRNQLKKRGSTPVEKIIKEVTGIQGQTDVVKQGQITSGNAVGAATEELGSAKDPHSAAMVELFQKQMQADADLAKMAEQQGKVMGFMADIFKPEGSFETQLKRLANARAGALANPSGK